MSVPFTKTCGNVGQPLQSLSAALLQVFPAALLGRMVTIPYHPLSDEILGSIVRLQLDRIGKRIDEQYSIPFSYDQAVVDLVTSRCTEVESGGRMIDAVLTIAPSAAWALHVSIAAGSGS